MQYVFFCVWLLSVNVMVLRFIYHAVSSILSYECTTIYLTLDGNLGCSQFRATHNIAGLTFCYMSLGEYIYTYIYTYTI